jgi:hypothetical protein
MMYYGTLHDIPAVPLSASAEPTPGQAARTEDDGFLGRFMRRFRGGA